jgi:primary-amine oxidase
MNDQRSDAATAEPARRVARHACDPLTSEEIAVAAAAVRAEGGLDHSAWFETIALDEEDKDRLIAGDPATRRAYVCCYEPESNRTFAGVVDLARRKLIRWHHVPDVQARIVIDEFVEGGRIAKADPEFCAACRKRGIEDLDKVLVEPWAAGYFGLPGEDGERIAYGQCWLANEAGDNPYARPIANLHPVIDLRRRRVLRVDDFGVVALPPDPGPIRLNEGMRTDLKPLQISQPEGASFTVDGYLVSWQKWRFRVGFNVREGLVLYDIGYLDGGRLRSIMHRASLAEMVVPYGDPRRGSFRRNAFDLGEYGIGSLYDSLTLGCDCLGHIHYFDVTAHDWHGTPVAIRNAVCLHEEDTGLLWKFGEWGRQDGAIRARSRRLAISGFATIGNYVYGLFWYFYQDGTIGVEVKATGIPLPNGHEPARCSEWGGAMAECIEGSVHQHIFSFRFDMAVDGPGNAVREINSEPVPIGPDNPHGNAIRTVTKVLESEQAAQRNVNLETARLWKIVNPNVLNRFGEPVGYKLVPGVNALPFLHPDAPVARRAQFMFRHFWATRYAPSELYPAGWYPNQHRGGEGIAKWTAADRRLENENVVVWYTLNYHHLPRPEDWPVQPVVQAGFHWMPSGFFDRNPALDVPPPMPQACH